MLEGVRERYSTREEVAACVDVEGARRACRSAGCSPEAVALIKALQRSLRELFSAI